MEANQDTAVFEIRPGFAALEADKGGRPAEIGVVLSNHFVTTLLPKKSLYQYTVTGLVTDEQKKEDDVPNRPRRNELMALALAKSDILHAQRNHFATDNLEFIVAWKDLRQLQHDVQSTQGSALENFGIVTREAFGTKHQQQSLPLTLMYNGTIPMDGVTAASSGNIQALPLRLDGETTISPTHAVNILISKAVSDQARHSNGNSTVFQLGGNKFFDTKNPITFDFGGVRAYRGYFAALKVGMGQPLLNVNRNTTAFYDHTNVNDFMAAYCNKVPGAQFTDT
ncbi:hypothetical protein BDV95DRAFT_612626 [Massariosphaeria phaeospora]|uniref:Argonaute linker 1 domain-containing protein n=1 Tax=Massariosphaeria phaeospora TaxID=100035 RepID=A0A7C8M2A2_9PLEO|nr:hypothetical protein BDV95DRAFT_612626 [Massariosphaeria phaeospora]